MIGRILHNQYRIVQELGRGGLGTAYLVEDLNPEYKTHPRFVVKHLQPDYTNCKNQADKDYLWKKALELFVREAKALQKLGRCTTQIPTLEDFFDEDNQFYIVQEWIEGAPLSGELVYGQGWTQQQTIQLLIDILEPLKFCHDEGVIHRDLKPDNLMRRRRNGELVIIDFGAVREVGQQLTLLKNGQPRPGSQIGTPGYMPIEQFNRSPVLASDVYAVGAIGMQAMTGMYPHEVYFDPSTNLFAWQKVPGCYATPAFAEVLNRMLVDNLSERYPNAGDALAALQSLLTSPIPSGQTKSKTQPKPQFRGWLSQEIFTFETANVYQVSERQVEVVKKPRWLGLGEKEERITKQVNVWKVHKSAGQAERFTEDLGNNTKLEMVHIPAGTFTMGAPATEKDSTQDERPQHLVTVPEFHMGRYAVTQEQYLAVMGKNPAYFPGAQLPVERVSWNDAQEFCEKLSAQTGKKYQLPSEARWEYACRANTSTPFHFGETITLEVANFDGYDRTTAVGSFPANSFGLADMHGNIWEWCEDYWNKSYQGAPVDGSAWSQNNNDDHRILRGGAQFCDPDLCRAAARMSWSAAVGDNNFGFRIIHLQDS